MAGCGGQSSGKPSSRGVGRAITLTDTPPPDATDESLPDRPQTTFPSGPPDSVRARPPDHGVRSRLPRRGQFHVPPTTRTRIAVRIRHNGESWPTTRPMRQELRARQLPRRSIIAVDRQRAQPLPAGGWAWKGLRWWLGLRTRPSYRRSTVHHWWPPPARVGRPSFLRRLWLEDQAGMTTKTRCLVSIRPCAPI
jgi:hypothetical protein